MWNEQRYCLSLCNTPASNSEVFYIRLVPYIYNPSYMAIIKINIYKYMYSPNGNRSSLDKYLYLRVSFINLLYIQLLSNLLHSLFASCRRAINSEAVWNGQDETHCNGLLRYNLPELLFLFLLVHLCHDSNPQIETKMMPSIDLIQHTKPERAVFPGLLFWNYVNFYIVSTP